MKRVLMRLGGYALMALLMITFGTSQSWAQGTAQISGSVKDQTGAVLPGVDVTATQTATGAKRAAVTDETGSYNLTNLPIGPYMLEVALPGFKTYVQSGIVLQVGTNPTVNAILEVGQVSDQIEVQADAALVETRSSGVGNVIDNQRVLELPLNGRNPTELIFLAGAATQAQANDASLNSGVRNYPTVVISVAGGMNNGLNYILDGGTHNDPENSLNLPMPFPDALQEFKVETSGLQAQYGHHAAGTVNAVTKSGTNAFHGDIFEFLRNGALNARKTTDLTNDGLKRNQFGGTFGGPIVKNKVFFFAGEQVTTQRAAPSSNLSRIPTQQMLAGDFSTFFSAACNGGRAITVSAAPFSGGTSINPSLFSPQALALVSRLPQTSDPCGQVRFGGSSNVNEYLTTGRVDYQINDKHSIFTRYMGARRDATFDYDGTNILTSSLGQVNQRTHSLVIGDTYLFGNGMVSSFHVTGIRTKNPRKHPEIIDFGDIGVKNIWLPFKGHMRLDVTNGFAISGVNVQPGFYNSTEGQVVEDLSLVKGSHQWGFGVNYIHSNFNGQSNVNAAPMFGFNGTALTQNGMADFLLGRPSTFSAGTNSNLYPRQTYFAVYLQDTWKASQHLTVNYGVRYEPFIAPYDGQGRTNYFTYEAFNAGFKSATYPKAPAGLYMPGDEGRPGKRYMENRLLHFAPRIGFAWDPSGTGRRTIRAAYGIFNDLPHLWTFYGAGANVPWNANISINNPSFADPWNAPSGSFPTGYPGGNPLPLSFNKNTDFPLSGSYLNFRQDAKSTYVHQWNLSLQQQAGENWLIAANYLGSSAIHLWGPQNQLNYAVFIPGASTSGNVNNRRILNLQNPAEGKYYQGIGELEDGGTANYNGMLLSIQRRRAKGLTIQGNYTLSHCIGDGVVSQPGSGGILPGTRKYSRGDCPSDRRQVVNLSTVVETPQFANTALRMLGSGWQVSGILRLQSGPSLTVLSGFDTTLNGANDNNRANQVLADPYLPNRSLANGWFNPAAFARPANGEYGNAANNYKGPGAIRVDMGLTRKFQVTEGNSVEFRAEAFNLPNHWNPGSTNAPNNTLSSQDFGKVKGTGSADDPRIIQFALKYVF